MVARRSSSGSPVVPARPSNVATAMPRRDLAGAGAAHAVGDHEQRRPRQVGVLVRPAHHAGVRGGGELDDSEGHATAS